MVGREQLIRLGDISLAVGLLTRLPVRVDTDIAASRGAGAAWAYPLAGGIVALLAGLIGLASLALGLHEFVAAGLTLLTQIVITGAMHEDGLADSADGLWGGWDKGRRLEIMKDSHIGTYGVLALGLSLGLRWSAISVLGPVLLPVLLVTAALSRAAMVAVMSTLPNAREGGLSASVGRPTLTSALIAVGTSALLALGLFAGAGLVMCLIGALGAVICAAIAKAKIGGQTGDILGATQQATEILCLICAAALLA